MPAPNVKSTLELVKKAMNAPMPDEIAKSFTQSATATSGLTAYDLEAPAKTLYPVLTPLRNRIPRVGARGGIQANWRAITGINTSNIRVGVGEGNRGGVIAHTTADYLAAYKGIGLEDYVTFEADYTAEYFDDAKARAVEGLLRSMMIGEEGVILGGNTSLALGTTPTPTLSTATTGGSIADATYNVACVALSFSAAWALQGWNNGVTGQTGAVTTSTKLADIDVIARTNADASSDTFGGGVAKPSATASTGALSGTGANTISASVTAVTGAFAYAWYVGTAGNEKLHSITNINSVKMTSLPASGNELLSAVDTNDNSRNALEFDGFLTIAASNVGAYWKALATGTAGTGTKLTADGAGGITEFEDMFLDRWNKYRLGFDTLYMNAQQLLDANALIIANGGAPLIRFAADQANHPTQIDAGVVIGTYLNKVTNTRVKIEVHPNLPAGTILGYAQEVPYKLSGIQNVHQVRCRRDYYQLEWPRRSRKYEYGVYADEVLQSYFPPALGVITNVAAGH